MQQPDDNRPDGLLDAAATKNVSDNYVGAYSLPVECGVNRVLVRSTVNAGEIKLSAYAEGVKPDYLTVKTSPVEVKDGLSEYLPQLTLKPCLDRGATPTTPSYTEHFAGVDMTLPVPRPDTMKGMPPTVSTITNSRSGRTTGGCQRHG